jgi:DNA-binding PadR family transcriptional regulator
MQQIRLTPTSYIVLGLIERAGAATPYELKRAVAVGIGEFWSLQHAQLYSEPERLARSGYLTETREPAGRRRKLYRLTQAGREALGDWLQAPTDLLPELRDIALLKIYLGAPRTRLAQAQLAAHQLKLRDYEQLWQKAAEHIPAGPRAALQAGIDHERAWVRFWGALTGGEPNAPASGPPPRSDTTCAQPDGL